MADPNYTSTDTLDIPLLPLVRRRHGEDAASHIFRQALLVLIMRSSFYIDQEPEPKVGSQAGRELLSQLGNLAIPAFSLVSLGLYKKKIKLAQ